jgi:hypothetical protein
MVNIVEGQVMGNESRPEGRGLPWRLRRLLKSRKDRDNLVARLRHSLAWNVDEMGLAAVARKTRISADKIIGFLSLPESKAGSLLSVAEAGRVARLAELRLEDRELHDKWDEAWTLAAVYIEVAGIDYEKAAATAIEVRDLYRAANPDAHTMYGASRLTVDG